MLRLLQPTLPAIARNPVGRTLLLAQLSARPWRLDGSQIGTELSSYARTPNFDALVRDLASGPMQRGPAAADAGRIALGWGRHDRLCLARQADRASAAFPSATLHWFEHSGHFPAWDEPAATVQFILRNTGRARQVAATSPIIDTACTIAAGEAVTSEQEVGDVRPARKHRKAEGGVTIPRTARPSAQSEPERVRP